MASSLLKPYVSAPALNLARGSIIGSKDKTKETQAVPITLQKKQSLPMLKAS